MLKESVIIRPKHLNNNEYNFSNSIEIKRSNRRKQKKRRLNERRTGKKA